MGEITLQLNSPLTDEQWDTITDVDFDHTDRITFHTKHGKEVDFVKFKPIKTNADKIRQMSDEELAFYIFNHPQWVDLDGYLDWLKQEVSE
jgi:hypothetical protein